MFLLVEALAKLRKKEYIEEKRSNDRKTKADKLENMHPQRESYNLISKSRERK